MSKGRHENSLVLMPYHATGDAGCMHASLLPTTGIRKPRISSSTVPGAIAWLSLQSQVERPSSAEQPKTSYGGLAKYRVSNVVHNCPAEAAGTSIA